MSLTNGSDKVVYRSNVKKYNLFSTRNIGTIVFASGVSDTALEITTLDLKQNSAKRITSGNYDMLPFEDQKEIVFLRSHTGRPGNPFDFYKYANGAIHRISNQNFALIYMGRGRYRGKCYFTDRIKPGRIDEVDTATGQCKPFLHLKNRDADCNIGCMLVCPERSCLFVSCDYERSFQYGMLRIDLKDVRSRTFYKKNNTDEHSIASMDSMQDGNIIAMRARVDSWRGRFFSIWVFDVTRGAWKKLDASARA